MKALTRPIVIAAAVSTLATAVVSSQNPPAVPPRDAGTKPPIGTAAIAGSVATDESTPSPVRRARVTVRSEAYGNGWSATTDDDGKFSIRSLPAGNYTVQASKPAWLIASYGATRPGKPGTPIALREGEQISDLKLSMSRSAVLTGTVFDRNGDPIPAVNVTVMRFAYSEVTGDRTLVRAGSESTTDDQGVYRCYGLLPGEYVIVATLRSGPATALMDLRRITADEVAQVVASARGATPAPAPSANQARQALVGYAPVYFPGTADPARATPVKLSAAEVKAGLNISLDVVPTARIEVTPTLPDQGNRQSVQVYLLAQQSTVGGASGMATGRREPDGRVIFAGVTPGAYTVIARAALAGAAPQAAPAPPTGRGGAGGAPLTLYASTDLVVNGIDQVVPIELKQGMTVSGHVVFDVEDRAPTDATINVSLIPMKSGPALSVSPARMDATGAFRLVGVPAGRYRIEYSAGRDVDAWRLISGQTRGREVLDTALDIRAGEDVADLVLRFTLQPSELAGRLQTSTGQPATAYSVIVFSASREFWIPASRRVRALRPATDGGFSVKGLPAGEYYVAALTDVEPGEWYDPAFLAQLVATSAKVAVRDGLKTVQDLMIK